MLPGQMSTWLLESVQDVLRNLSLKLHHNQVLRYSWYGQMLPGQMSPLTITVGICSRCSQEPTFKVSSKSSWDIVDIEFLWCGGVKPNRCVEVRLGFWQKCRKSVYLGVCSFEVFSPLKIILTFKLLKPVEMILNKFERISTNWKHFYNNFSFIGSFLV